MPLIPGMQPVQEPPLELIVKNAQMQVMSVNGQTLMRFLIPGAGIAIGIPLSDSARETLISQLRGDNLVITPSLPT